MNAFQLVSLYGQGKQVFDALEHDGILNKLMDALHVLQSALHDPGLAKALKEVSAAAKNPKALLEAGEHVIQELGEHANVVIGLSGAFYAVEAELDKPEVKAFIEKLKKLLPAKK